MPTLTKTQREAMAHLADGREHAFGSGVGRLRVALRALHHKAPDLVHYGRCDNGLELFRITDAGRAALGES